MVLLTVSLRDESVLTYKSNYDSFISRVINEIVNANNINVEVIEIITLKSSVKGSGRELLKLFCNSHNESVIVLKAEPMYDTEEKYVEARVFGKFDKSLEKLNEYYKSNGFIDINSYAGYNSACSLIYGNEMGIRCVSILKNCATKGEKQNGKSYSTC